MALALRYVQDSPKGNAHAVHLPDGRGGAEARGRREARSVPHCKGR